VDPKTGVFEDGAKNNQIHPKGVPLSKDEPLLPPPRFHPKQGAIPFGFGALLNREFFIDYLLVRIHFIIVMLYI